MINFSAKYVDTHCHLDLYKNFDEVVKEAEKTSVLIIGVTNTPSVFFFTEKLSKQHKNIVPAVGLHPELAVQRKHELTQLWDYLETTQFVGEVGLDYATK